MISEKQLQEQITQYKKAVTDQIALYETLKPKTDLETYASITETLDYIGRRAESWRSLSGRCFSILTETELLRMFDDLRSVAIALARIDLLMIEVMVAKNVPMLWMIEYPICGKPSPERSV